MLYSFKLKITSINKNILFLYTKFIINILKKILIKFKSINFPKKKKLITLLKSPHVYKKAQEHYELIIHRKMFIIKGISLDLIKFIYINKPKTLKFNLKKYETYNS